MTTKTVLIAFLCTSLLPTAAGAQALTMSNRNGGTPAPALAPTSPGISASAELTEPSAINGNGGAGEPGDKKDDPAYKLYKKGYDLVLDGRWEEARKQLGEVLKLYPSSEFADDAEYWMDYALMHSDRKKALEAYEKFVEHRPASRYYDEAVADLADLRARRGVEAIRASARTAPVAVAGGSHLYYIDSLDADGGGFIQSSDSLVVARINKKFRGNGVNAFEFGYGQSAKSLSRALELQARSLRAIRLPTMASTPRAALAPGMFESDEDDFDQDTRLKLEALEAIGSSKEDSASFRALKEIALNRSSHRRLRTEAMEQLVDFKKYDPLPVFLEVAKTDTGKEIQNAAIDYIGMLTKDKNRSVETLIELFYAIPADRSEQRENIFYSIAEVGNDRAVDFLAKIAQTDQKYALRSQAIYYLGSIGNDRAKTALYEILREK